LFFILLFFIFRKVNQFFCNQLNSSEQNNSLPFKVKLQPFNPKFDDILTFLSEFDAVGNQAKWTDEIKILQLRTLLTGEARQVFAKRPNLPHL
jgi:hypothetical protein